MHSVASILRDIHHDALHNHSFGDYAMSFEVYQRAMMELEQMNQSFAEKRIRDALLITIFVAMANRVPEVG